MRWRSLTQETKVPYRQMWPGSSLPEITLCNRSLLLKNHNELRTSAAMRRVGLQLQVQREGQQAAGDPGRGELDTHTCGERLQLCLEGRLVLQILKEARQELQLLVIKHCCGPGKDGCFIYWHLI